MNLLPLIIMGALFVVLVLGLRYYTYKTMTERVCAKDPDSEYCKAHYQKNLDKSDNQYKNCEILFGETPNGGVKTAICYIDDKNRKVQKSNAKKVLVRELDAKNRPVYETWTTLDE